MAVFVPCWRNTLTRKPTVWATLSRSLGQAVRGASRHKATECWRSHGHLRWKISSKGW